MRACCSSTVITKCLSTFASHSAASLSPLYPVFTLWTLLKFCPLCKVYKLLIVFPKAVVDPILCTAHSSMIIAFALQTVVFFAGWTTVIVKGRIKLESSRAASCWAPGHRGTITLDKFIKRKLLKFLLKLAVDILINIAGLHLSAAGLHRASDVQVVGLYLCLQITVKALWMKNMTAFQNPHKRRVYLAKANLALPSLFLSFLDLFPPIIFLLLEHLSDKSLVSVILSLFLPFSKNKPFILNHS